MLLADLGMSSSQLGDPQRGLSFQLPGPLDMRLDPRLQRTAADLVNTLPEGQLAELLFELISQRYECGSTLITSNLPFDEWTGTFGSERLTGALLDRLTHHVHILEMNGESYRLSQSRARKGKANR